MRCSGGCVKLPNANKSALAVLADEGVQPEVNSSGEDANGDRDQQHFLLPDFLRLSNGYRNAWREHSLERFVIQVSIVHRHFPGMIELGVVHDDLRVEFCSQARAGMKLRPLGHGAIISRPNADRHLVSAGVLVAVELDHGFWISRLLKNARIKTLPPNNATIFPEIVARPLWLPRGRFGLRGLCLRGCRCSAGREFLSEWCAEAPARRKRDRNLRVPGVPWLNRIV